MATHKSGFVKYAAAQIVEVLNPEDVWELTQWELSPKMAAMDPVLLDPKRFIYTRERAISSYERYGLNGNYDGWVEPELMRSYASFVNVPRYVDHDNVDPARAVGIVLDATYHPLVRRGGKVAGGWVETISARDKTKMADTRLMHLPGQPTLLEAVLAGTVTDVSMGCFVEESVCTICGNRAQDTYDYCNHVLSQKGAMLKVGGKSPLISMGWNVGDAVQVGELNYGVTFFELSDITTQVNLGGGGADPDAKVLERVAGTPAGVWESKVVDRMRTLRPLQKVPGEATTKAAHLMHTTRGTTTMAKNKQAQEASPPNLQQMVADDDKITQEAEPADYPTEGQSDKDQALFDQSTEKSGPTDDQNVIDSDDKITQETEPKDHPQTAGHKRKGDFIPTNSDPSNTLGQKPEQVKDAEDEQREEKFEKVEPKLPDDKAEDVGEKMEDEMEDEDEMIESRMTAALQTLPKRVRNSEACLTMQDEFFEAFRESRSLAKKAAEQKSQAWRTRYNRQAKENLAKATKILRQILAYGTEPEGGGAQQESVDIPDTYETSGDPDKNLNEQSRGTSEPSLDETVQDAGDVAQEEAPDRPPSGEKATAAGREAESWKRIQAEGDADAAVEEMAKRVAQEGPDKFDEIQQDVFDQYGTTPQENRAGRRVAKELPPEFKEQQQKMKEKAKDLEPGEEMTSEMQEPRGKDSARRKRAEEESAEHEKAESPEFEAGEEEEVKESKCKDKMGASSHDIIMGKVRWKGQEAASVPTDETEAKDPKMAASEEEELNPNAGEKDTDIGRDVKEDASNDDAIGKGTAPTLESPATEDLTGGGGEFIQMDATRRNLLARVKLLGQNEAEDRLEQGTGPTKASPSTSDAADSENEFQTKELMSESQGTSATPAPPILSTKHAMALRLVAVLNENKKLHNENLRLRESNERYYQRAEKVAKAWKFESCKKLALAMMDRGSFMQDASDPNNVVQRSVPDQRKAAFAYAKNELMRWGNDEIEREMKVIASIPPLKSRVQEWEHKVKMPQGGTVKRAHQVPSRTVSRSDLDDDMFVQDSERGF